MNQRYHTSMSDSSATSANNHSPKQAHRKDMILQMSSDASFRASIFAQQNMYFLLMRLL
jgi:hypothetical protein